MIAWRLAGRRQTATRASSPSGRPANQSGYGLFIESDGRLAVWLGGAAGTGREGPRPDDAAAMGAVDSRNRHQPAAAARDDLVVLRRRELRCRSRPRDAEADAAHRVPVRSDAGGHRADDDA